MPYTKCPNCRKVHRVTRNLLSKEIGCMSPRCGAKFTADEYFMHSGPLSKTVSYFVISFALVMLFRWVGLNSTSIFYLLG